MRSFMGQRVVVTMQLRAVVGLVRYLVFRPCTACRFLRAGWHFRAWRWYRRAPFLPIPPPEYLSWRLHTAYGESDTQPDPGELDRYLRWVEGMRRLKRRRRQ